MTTQVISWGQINKVGVHLCPCAERNVPFFFTTVTVLYWQERGKKANGNTFDKPVTSCLSITFLTARKAGYVTDRLAVLKEPAAISESQLTGRGSVIKLTLWSMMMGTLVTCRTQARNNISAHGLSKQGIITLSTSSNTEVMLRMQTLIKITDTFVKLSECNRWSQWSEFS